MSNHKGPNTIIMKSFLKFAITKSKHVPSRRLWLQQNTNLYVNTITSIPITGTLVGTIMCSYTYIHYTRRRETLCSTFDFRVGYHILYYYVPTIILLKRTHTECYFGVTLKRNKLFKSLALIT